MVQWNTTVEKLPELYKAVLLTRNPSEDFTGTDVGRILERDDKSGFAWFCTNDGKFRTLSARPYWIYLEDKEVMIPEGLSEEEMAPYVSILLGKLGLFERKFIRLGASMMVSGKGLYPLDYFVSGILNRSLSLIYGFETLINSSNFLSASHLVRPMLDNYLRLTAATLVSDPDDFAMKVLEGKPVDKLKDRDGQLMRDGHLKKKANEQHPWIENVYNETSGFIHFSNKHIWNATNPSESKPMVLETYIGKYDNKVANASKLEATACMIEICNCLAGIIFWWVDKKRLHIIQSQNP